MIALGGIVVSRSIRVAGDELDEEIIRYAREKYNHLVGERMAEKAKMAIGSAYPLEQEQTMLLRGRNLLTGLPQSVEVSSVEIREALSGPIHIITDGVRNTLGRRRRSWWLTSWSMARSGGGEPSFRAWLSACPKGSHEGGGGRGAARVWPRGRPGAGRPGRAAQGPLCHSSYGRWR